MVARAETLRLMIPKPVWLLVALLIGLLLGWALGGDVIVSIPTPEKILIATCLGDALTTTTAYYVLGLPEAGLLPKMLLPVIGPAYFLLQYKSSTFVNVFSD